MVWFPAPLLNLTTCAPMMHVRFVYLKRRFVAMADEAWFDNLKLLMVRNIKCGYSFSLCENELNTLRPKLRRLCEISCSATKSHRRQQVHKFKERYYGLGNETDISCLFVV